MLLDQIRAGRALADKAARNNNARMAALATSPLGLSSHTTPDPRYARMLERFGLTAQEQLTCGFHVHTYIESKDEGVAVRPAGIYGTYAAYRRVVTRLLDSGVMLDEGMIYFDARLSRNHPTVEVRVADVCLRAEDALIAVLVRALVETASREWHDGVEPAPVPAVARHAIDVTMRGSLDSSKVDEAPICCGSASPSGLEEIV